MSEKYKKYLLGDSISSVATALSPSAIGCVRVSGKNCIEMVAKIFSRPDALIKAKGNTFLHGWIVDGGDDSNGDDVGGDAGCNGDDGRKKIDEVVVNVYREPKSFTGENMVEIFCHGGVSVVQAVQNLLLKNGFRQAERGEYTFRAFINGKTDLTRAEAVREIIESNTSEARNHAVSRLSGNLFNEIDKIKKLLVDTLASIEVEVEYPEDEETIADSFDKTNLTEAENRLSVLAASWKAEKIYQDGVKVVLAGKTNAGKSSLFNAILKEERAIVSEIEGTTRDWLECMVDLNGIPVRLFDTAGLRETDDKIEARGVEITENLCKDCDVILYLIDFGIGKTKEDEEFLKKCEKPVIVVWSKSDSDKQLAVDGGQVLGLRLQDLGECSQGGSGQWSVSGQGKGEKQAVTRSNDGYASKVDCHASLCEARNDGGETSRVDCHDTSCLAMTKAVCVSAKTGVGLERLYEAIRKCVESATENSRATVGVGSERQKNAVLDALSSVQHAINISDDYALDAVIQDLEDAISALGEITGETTTDDVLSSIFSRFCVGK